MSYLSNIRALWNHLLSAIRYAHQGCRLVAKIDAKVQASNADDTIKTASTNLLTAMTDFCAAIEAFKESLPGE